MNPDTTYYNSHEPDRHPHGRLRAPPWVVNGDGPGGLESVAAATTISDNVVFAQLSVDVGPQNTVDIAHRMGITSPLDAVPSITLGTSGVTPLEMADAYATLAADGIHHKPQAIVKVRDAAAAASTGSPRPPASAPSPPASRQRRHAVPRARRAARRHGLARRLLLPVPARRQDGHHRETAGTSGTRATRRSWRPRCGWATWTRTRP